jgi:hypothetical protein
MDPARIFTESLTPRPELENPARIFTESLTPRPELENSLGPSRRFQRLTISVAIGGIADMTGNAAGSTRSRLTHLRDWQPNLLRLLR